MLFKILCNLQHQTRFLKGTSFLKGTFFDNLKRYSRPTSYQLCDHFSRSIYKKHGH